jgi:hypothetical protein
MSLQLKMFYSALVGAWGGLLAWVILDLLLVLQMSSVWLDAMVNGLVVGVSIGVLVGAFDGLMEGNTGRLLRGLLAGLVTGFIGGAAGLLIGELLFQAFDRQVAGRLLGWAIFGLALGSSEGLAYRSGRRLLHGSLGGLLGGGLGGIAFTLIRQELERPATGRAWGFAILGAFVGLFVGLVPLILKTAWLKVVSSGRDEGKEHIVEKAITTIGRSESADMGLYGDPTLLPVHAEIRQENGRFILHSKGAVMVNGQPVNSHPLQDEDQIGLGRVKVRFRSNRSG